MLRPRTHIWVFLGIFIAAAAAIAVFIYRIDPFKAGIYRLVIFFGLFFLASFALTTILGYFFRIMFWRSGVRYEFLKVARRQGVWFGIMAVIALLLETANIFSFLTAILLFSAFALIEFYAQ